MLFRSLELSYLNTFIIPPNAYQLQFITIFPHQQIKLFSLIYIHVQSTCTLLLLVGLSSASNVTVIHCTHIFTVAGSPLRCKANLYSFYELSRANAICFERETGTLHYNINVHVPNQRAIQAVWLYML